MADEKKTIPPVLFRKVFLTALAGVGCFAVGAGYYLYCRDGMMLLLSGLVLLFGLFRAASLYRTITAEKYEIVEGTCVGVSSIPFRRQLRIRIMDADGIETSLCLGKQSGVKIGFCYRFFFKEERRPSLGNEFLDIALVTGHFLGFEELGKYSFLNDAAVQEQTENKGHIKK